MTKIETTICWVGLGLVVLYAAYKAVEAQATSSASTAASSAAQNALDQFNATPAGQVASSINAMAADYGNSFPDQVASF